MLKVAMLSRWHVHADDYAREVREHPQLQVGLVWDEDVSRGKAWAMELGVPFVEKLEDVLSDATVDGVVVDTPTDLHEEVIVKAAKSGKHIFSEKVLAIETESAERILAAVDEAGVQLMLSLPRLSHSYYLMAEAVLKSGLLGRLTTARCRVSHNGSVSTPQQPNGWLPEHFYDLEACGGGALIDLGAHPIYLMNRLCGPAEAVTARFNYVTEKAVEDHAVVISEHPNHIFATMETGFVNNGMPFQLELSGTEGTLLVEDQSVRVKSKHFSNSNWWTEADGPLDGVHIPDVPSPMSQWVEAILHNKTPYITREDMLWLTKVNVAAAQSHKEGKRQLV